MDAPPGPLQLLSDYEELRTLMTYGLYVCTTSRIAAPFASALTKRLTPLVQVMPDSLDLYLWHGLINIREGRYKGGSFRFILVRDNLFASRCRRPSTWRRCL